MKDIFNKDITIKIISGLIAITLWLYVLDVQNPETEIPIRDIPINILGTESITEHGLFILNQEEETINLKVKGRRKTLAALNNKNINVFADLAGLNQVGEYTVPMQVDIPIDGVIILDKKPYHIMVNLDKMMEIQKPVNIITKGTVKEPYILLEPYVKPNVITLKGPSTIIRTIDDLRATIDLSGQTKDIISLQKYDILDRLGEKINSKDISTQVDIVEILYPIIKSKEVEVIPKLIGTLSEDYIVTNSEVLPSIVKVAGSGDIVDDIEQIFTQPINVERLDKSVNINISIIIPEGLRLIDTEDIVNVKVNIEKQALNNINIQNIKGENIGTDLSYDIEQKQVGIILKCTESEAKKIQEGINSPENNRVYAYVDLGDLQEGQHILPIKIKGYPNVEVIESTVVNVNVFNKNNKSNQ